MLLNLAAVDPYIIYQSYGINFTLVNDNLVSDLLILFFKYFNEKHFTAHIKRHKLKLTILNSY